MLEDEEDGWLFPWLTIDSLYSSATRLRSDFWNWSIRLEESEETYIFGSPQILYKYALVEAEKCVTFVDDWWNYAHNPVETFTTPPIAEITTDTENEFQRYLLHTGYFVSIAKSSF